MKCPACGAGPVALLEQMLDGIGGGKVTLTIEGRDLVAIAGLLATHDPAFDTVIESSELPARTLHEWSRRGSDAPHLRHQAVR
jgi:hypothetical protein